MRTADQVTRNVELYGRQAPDELWTDLATRGLIRFGATV
jgi:hypothetical protein